MEAKKVLILGMDGYLGWSLAMSLSKRGHTVFGMDNFLRRKMVQEVKSESAIPIHPMHIRLAKFKELFGKDIGFYYGNLLDMDSVFYVIKRFQPDAIVHFGEIPSAPYSMMDVSHANDVFVNNVCGTLNVLYAIKNYCPDAHLVKLGTMGEYGTPNIDIPEGFFEIEYRGRKDRLLFPRQAGSWYHQSKVHDTNNIIFACKIWDLRSTDIMQGVVYGTKSDEMMDDTLRTRFDYDGVFGTAINRFCSQAVIGFPLTPYGKKAHQTRGYLALRDSIQCLTIAIENPAEKGEYRTFNQFSGVYSVIELAKLVQKVGNNLGLDVKINNIENPRIESQEHYYNPDSNHLRNLGFRPKREIEDEIELMINDLIVYKDIILRGKDQILPKVLWDDTQKNDD